MVIYIYDSVEYVNSKIKVEIECPEHGKFMQRPNIPKRFRSKIIRKF